MKGCASVGWSGGGGKVVGADDGGNLKNEAGGEVTFTRGVVWLRPSQSKISVMLPDMAGEIDRTVARFVRGQIAVARSAGRCEAKRRAFLVLRHHRRNACNLSCTRCFLDFESACCEEDGKVFLLYAQYHQRKMQKENGSILPGGWCYYVVRHR